jgi:hypothetical protein
MLALSRLIKDVQSSNLGAETGYLNRFSVEFLDPSRQMPEQYLTLARSPLLPEPFQFIIH